MENALKMLLLQSVTENSSHGPGLMVHDIAFLARPQNIWSAYDGI